MDSLVLLVPLLIVATAALYGPEVYTDNAQVSTWRNRVLFGLEKGIGITAIPGIIATRFIWTGEHGLSLSLSLVGISFAAAMYVPLLVASAWGRSSARNYWEYVQAAHKWSARKLIVWSIAVPIGCFLVAAIMVFVS